MDDDEMDTADWRTQLQPDSRQRIINKIVEKSMKFLPDSGPEGLLEIQRFEETIYTAATSQSDYLRKISIKMLTMETKSQTTGMANTIPSTSAGSAQNPPNPVYYVRENEQFMDCNNWRPIKAEPNMDTTDWRTQVQPDSRHRIVIKIMETLKRHLPMSGPEGLVELNSIAARFEDRIFGAATSQSDYLRKIYIKMLTVESKSQTTPLKKKKSQTTPFEKKKSQTTGMANTIQSNSAGSSQNPPDSGQSQIPLSNEFEAWQQLLSQNVENTIANTGVQSSANLPSALPSVTSLTHTSTANAAGQSTNMQSGIEQNSVRSSVSQGLPSNIFSNSQFLYQQQQLQHQMLSYSMTHTGQDAIDWSWRITLQPDSRQKQHNRILETLKNCFPICGSMGLVELTKIAEFFEEEIYTAATSHLDYLRIMYSKILKMETRFQTAERENDSGEKRKKKKMKCP